MVIAVIGAGNVGGTLARRWAACGHEIVLGVRDPTAAPVAAVVEAAGSRARAASVAAAAAAAELVVLATPWSAAQAAIESAGPLAGKVLVDCTNPLAPGLAGLSVGHATSAAELIAGWAPGARVVKAFNSTGSGNMANPEYPEGRVAMFVCGDDMDARNRVLELAREIGFNAIDAGELRAARYLEPLAMLWIHLAYRVGAGPDIGFALLSR